MAVVFENNKGPVDRLNISVKTACCLLIFDTPRTWGTWTLRPHDVGKAEMTNAESARIWLISDTINNHI